MALASCFTGHGGCTPVFVLLATASPQPLVPVYVTKRIMPPHPPWFCKHTGFGTWSLFILQVPNQKCPLWLNLF